jgi:hypothetical protein
MRTRKNKGNAFTVSYSRKEWLHIIATLASYLAETEKEE